MSLQHLRLPLTTAVLAGKIYQQQIWGNFVSKRENIKQYNIKSATFELQTPEIYLMTWIECESFNYHKISCNTKVSTI